MGDKDSDGGQGQALRVVSRCERGLPKMVVGTATVYARKRRRFLAFVFGVNAFKEYGPIAVLYGRMRSKRKSRHSSISAKVQVCSKLKISDNDTYALR